MRRYIVAILMTLEGEYYVSSLTYLNSYYVVAILMTLEGEYYYEGNCRGL